MSRIGKLPVAIPEKVTVAVDDTTIRVEGPQGKLSKSFDTHVKITVDGSQLVIEPTSRSRQARVMWGTARSIIQGMVDGVIKPYEKNLEIQGVGFKAQLKGKVLDLALGYSHPIEYTIPEGVTVAVDGGTKIKVTGPDKHMVGQVTADIKSFYPVEPYKGKGVRIVGDYVRRKEGKKTS